MDLRRALQRHDRQMFATFDEVDLERELISRLTGNRCLWLRAVLSVTTFWTFRREFSPLEVRGGKHGII